jgi:hypothetical protein
VLTESKSRHFTLRLSLCVLLRACGNTSQHASSIGLRAGGVRGQGSPDIGECRFQIGAHYGDAADDNREHQAGNECIFQSRDAFVVTDETADKIGHIRITLLQ